MFNFWIFYSSQPPLMWPDGRSPPGKKYTGAENLGVTRKIPTDVSITLSYFYRGSKMGKFCPNFRPHSYYQRSGFKTEQCIENLKNAQMIGLNSGQDSSPIAPPIFTRVKKTNFAQFCHFRGSSLQTEQQRKNPMAYNHPDVAKLGPPTPRSTR